MMSSPPQDNPESALGYNLNPLTQESICKKTCDLKLNPNFLIVFSILGELVLIKWNINTEVTLAT